jgi:hypothetical protein
LRRQELTLMGKSPKSQDNCFKIFAHATRFHDCDHRLRNTLPANQPEQVPLVAHLYLKCLLCLETGRAHHGHHLRNLFDKLQPDTRERLKALWDVESKKPARQRVLDHIRSLPGGDKLRDDLPNLLLVGANAFQELRYFYETEKSIFLLQELPNVLRGVILERMPWWATTASPVCWGRFR